MGVGFLKVGRGSFEQINNIEPPIKNYMSFLPTRQLTFHSTWPYDVNIFIRVRNDYSNGWTGQA